MWKLLLVLFVLGSCFIITLIFGLLRARAKADEDMEKVLEGMTKEGDLE